MFVLTSHLGSHRRFFHSVQSGSVAHEYERGRDYPNTLRRFKLKYFRDGQEQAVDAVLDGFDTLVVLPTGTGKSLIYQVAALHRPGVTVVVSPLIALMKDQVDKLESLEIPATFINSTLTASEREERLDKLAKGAYKIVYVAPERLRQYFFQERIQQVQVGLLAVDEAHCISQWGHDFRPDYLHIARFRRFVGNPPLIALTATATSQVRIDIVDLLQLKDVRRVIRSADRPNIHFAIQTVDEDGSRYEPKFELLRELFRGRRNDAAIIYAGTRKDAEMVAWFLRDELRLKAEHYHAGMETYEREKVQEAFIDGSLPIVAATNAFGMGIDRPDVRMVVHFSLPGSLEAYYQEAGRAGRDGHPAEAILLYRAKDRELQEFFIEQSELRYSELERLYKNLTVMRRDRDDLDAVTFNVDELSGQCHFDAEGVKVRVGLQRLEEAGVIEQGWYQGLERNVTLRAWKTNAVEAIVQTIKVHSDRKYRQLTTLIAFAKARECRRHGIMRYFDEHVQGFGRRRCCDVCDERRAVGEFVASIKSMRKYKQTAQKSRPPLAGTILDCVRAFDGLRTPEQLLEILQGKVKGYNRFRESKFHGSLAAYQEREIRAEIDTLIQKGELTINHSNTIHIIEKK